MSDSDSVRKESSAKKAVEQLGSRRFSVNAATVVAGLAVLALVPAGWAMVSAWPSGERDSGASVSEGPSSRVMEDVFEVERAAFWMHEEGEPLELAELEDGAWQPPGTDDGEEVRVVGDPVFSDVDGDGMYDAAAVLEWTGDDDSEGWRSAHLWLWNDGDMDPVKYPAGWQWECANVGSGEEAAFEISESAGRLLGHGIQISRLGLNSCADDEESGLVSVNVGVDAETGLPIRINDSESRAEASDPLDFTPEIVGAVEPCVGGNDPRWNTEPGEVGPNDVGYMDLPESVEALIHPDAEAPAVRGEDPVLRVPNDWEPSEAELERHDGYVSVRVVWHSDDESVNSCGWVQWDEVQAAQD